MIVVDTSVWIDHLNDIATPEVETLRGLVGLEPILVGDLILCEVLQGLRTDREAAQVESALRRFEVASMLDAGLAVRAAQFYRLLRGKGITIRKTIDLIIATFCIERGHALLHADRDFDPFEQRLGLHVLRA